MPATHTGLPPRPHDEERTVLGAVALGLDPVPTHHRPTTAPAIRALLSKALHGLDAFIINATHDEIVLEVGDADVSRAKTVLEECMTAGMLDVFPTASTQGLVEARTGKSWADK